MKSSLPKQNKFKMEGFALVGAKILGKLNTRGTEISLPSEMRNWILPPWFSDQNNPLSVNYSAGKVDFYNYTGRSWTVLRGDASKTWIRLDRYGIIYLSQPRVSIEVWVYNQTILYTPGTYLEINQRFGDTSGGIDVCYRLKDGFLTMTVTPISSFTQSGIEVQISTVINSERFLDPLMVGIVIRPYDDDGLAPIRLLEYNDRYLKINGRKALRCEEEPQHLFFTNASRGDVRQYFSLWEGNTKIEAADGSCTGMIGFSDIPSRLRPIKIVLNSEESRIHSRLKHSFLLKIKVPPVFLQKNHGMINTNTKLDEIYKANMRHLSTFCLPKTVDAFQILVLNRFGLTEISNWYLKESLRKVGWDGSLADQYVGGTRIMVAIIDYYKISRDQKLVETYWPVLKRVGFWLCNQTNVDIVCQPKIFPPTNPWETGIERFFWICGSLSALAELGTAVGKNSEIQVFKNHYLRLWAKLLNTIQNRLKIDGNNLNYHSGQEAVQDLVASYPLRLVEKGEKFILRLINLVIKHHLFRGGVFSPRDFKGIQLELTARLGQVMIREGIEYHEVLNLLVTKASKTWSWPDLLNPLSNQGIGEKGHDPRVIYQMLLLIRCLFVIEEGETLHLLPGIFYSRFWEGPQIELFDFPTYFGTISLKVRTIGSIIQLNFNPNFIQRPQKIILNLEQKYHLVFADTYIENTGGVLSFGPDLRVMRLRKVKT
jgi:hypothetical protein